jgi:hypothetical protein
MDFIKYNESYPDAVIIYQDEIHCKEYLLVWLYKKFDSQKKEVAIDFCATS